MTFSGVIRAQSPSGSAVCGMLVRDGKIVERAPYLRPLLLGDDPRQAWELLTLKGWHVTWHELKEPA